MKLVFQNILSSLKEYNSERDELTKKSGQEGLEKIQRDSEFRVRSLTANPNLNESQKIVEMHALELNTAQLRYAEEMKTAEALSTQKDRDEAIHRAELSNEVELQKVRKTTSSESRNWKRKE